MYVPMQYQTLNAAMAYRVPNTLHDSDSTTRYFERYFMQKAVSVLDVDIPADWDKDFFLYCLTAFGYCVVTDTDEYGIVPQAAAINGIGLYYQPTHFDVQNSLVRKSGTLGVDGVLIRMTPDYMGIYDMIHQYAYKMSLIYSAIDQSLINSRLAWALGARNKNAAQTLKAAIDRILRGEPGVVIDKKILDEEDGGSPIIELFNRNPKENYITDLLLRDAQTLETRFNREIGIPDVTEDKGDRLTAQEASELNAGASAKVTLWIENINASFNELFRVYGIRCRARVRDLAQGGETVNENGGNAERDASARPDAV